MCDPLARFSWTAMVARVGTVTATVARLSDMLRTSCGLIWFCGALWWGAGSGGCRHFWLTTCMGKLKGVLLTFESGGLAPARLGALQQRESYPLVSSCTAESTWKTAKGKDLD